MSLIVCLQGKDTVSFERFLHFKKSGGNHCHFNVIAVKPSQGHKAEAMFQAAADRVGMTLQRVAGPSRVRFRSHVLMSFEWGLPRSVLWLVTPVA